MPGNPFRDARSTQDFYAILETSPHASQAQIRSAYRHMALKYHADKTAGNTMLAEKYLILQIAYEVLTHPEAKQIYDDLRQSRQARAQRAQRAQSSGEPKDKVVRYASAGFNQPSDGNWQESESEVSETSESEERERREEWERAETKRKEKERRKRQEEREKRRQEIDAYQCKGTTVRGLRCRNPASKHLISREHCYLHQPDPDSWSCKGITQQGRRCRKPPSKSLPYKDYCHYHQSQALDLSSESEEECRSSFSARSTPPFNRTTSRSNTSSFRSGADIRTGLSRNREEVPANISRPSATRDCTSPTCFSTESSTVTSPKTPSSTNSRCARQPTTPPSTSPRTSSSATSSGATLGHRTNKNTSTPGPSDSPSPSTSESQPKTQSNVPSASNPTPPPSAQKPEEHSESINRSQTNPSTPSRKGIPNPSIAPPTPPTTPPTLQPKPSAKPPPSPQSQPHSRSPSPTTTSLQASIALLHRTIPPHLLHDRRKTADYLASLIVPSPKPKAGHIYLFRIISSCRSSSAQSPAAAAKPALTLLRHFNNTVRANSLVDILRCDDDEGEDADAEAGFWATSRPRRRTVAVKIGQSVDVPRRMGEWMRKCGHDGLDVVSWPRLMGQLGQEEGGRGEEEAVLVEDVARAERLLHLVLDDRRVRGERCECGAVHREWFEVECGEEMAGRLEEDVNRCIRLIRSTAHDR